MFRVTHTYYCILSVNEKLPVSKFRYFGKYIIQLSWLLLSSCFKAWKAGKCTRASYNTAKRISRRVVHHACHEADKVVYEGIDHKSSDIFRLANQMRKLNVDVGDKPVKNDTGEMSMSEEAKQNAWAEHYERLLKVEFDWDPDHLSNEPPPIPITIDMVKKAISKMKSGQNCRSIRHSGGDDQGSR